MICLTATTRASDYDSPYTLKTLRFPTMTNPNKSQTTPPLLSDEATRVRWDWVHRAITTAKSRNAESLLAAETGERAEAAPRLVKG